MSQQPVGSRPGAEQTAPLERPVVHLPSGRTLDPQRSRWAGVLDHEEIGYCRANGIALAYDCVQIGWVTAACVDDEPLSASGERSVDLMANSSPEQDAKRMLSVLVAQRALYAAQQGFVATRLARQVNQITLYKALGGRM